MKKLLLGLGLLAVMGGVSAATYLCQPNQQWVNIRKGIRQEIPSWKVTANSFTEAKAQCTKYNQFYNKTLVSFTPVRQDE